MQKVILTVVLLMISIVNNGQNRLSYKYDKALLKLSNKSTSFFITNPVQFKDSTGRVVSVRSIVELEDPYMRKIKSRYGKGLVQDLVVLLNDPERDWAANIMLYAISEASAVTLKFYNKDKIKEWRVERKEADMEKWKNYQQSIKSNITSLD